MEDRAGDFVPLFCAGDLSLSDEPDNFLLLPEHDRAGDLVAPFRAGEPSLSDEPDFSGVGKRFLLTIFDLIFFVFSDKNAMDAI